MKGNIFLIGFMGTGKSTIGKLVSDKLNLDFIDTDHVLEERFNMSITNIFKKYGEDYFRQLEHKLIQEIIRDKNALISTGGGTPIYYGSMAIMKKNGLVITLEASPHILWQRLKSSENRPLLSTYDTYEKFCSLYDYRNKIYRQAHFIISTDGKTIDQIVDEVTAYIYLHNGGDD